MSHVHIGVAQIRPYSCATDERMKQTETQAWYYVTTTLLSRRLCLRLSFLNQSLRLWLWVCVALLQL